MSTELPFFLAAAISLSVSALIAAMLYGPLCSLVEQRHGDANTSVFWGRFVAILLVFAPIVSLMISHGLGPRVENSAYSTLEYLRWPFLGLLGTLIVVAALASSNGNRQSYFEGTHEDELSRLIARVDAIRVRHAANATNPYVQHESVRM